MSRIADHASPDDACADDPNELSFKEGEVLEIGDKGGNWWRARNADGLVGSASLSSFQRVC
ncbi:hypothetical protein B0H11DRAFT_2009633 [Mycena galericulata]|nr:hypothetical protein B0H11DRAFT_2009633 [Mycena galericulata]